MLNQALHSGFYKAGKDFIQPILKTIALSIPLLVSYSDDKRSSVFIGILYGCIFILTSFASRNAQRFADKLGSDAAALNTTLYAGALSGVTAGILYWFELPVASGALYLLIFILENLRKPAGIAYISDTLKPKAMATTLSTLSQVKTIVTALFALLLGASIDIFGLGPGIAGVFGIFTIASLFFSVK